MLWYDYNCVDIWYDRTDAMYDMTTPMLIYDIAAHGIQLQKNTVTYENIRMVDLNNINASVHCKINPP